MLRKLFKQEKEVKKAPKIFGGSNAKQISQGFKEVAATDRISYNSSDTLEKNEEEVLYFENILDEISYAYSTGNIHDSISMLRDHINEHQGQVDKEVWFMLFDCFQITNNKREFDKISEAYYKVFKLSPPIWVPEKTISNDFKGILIFPEILDSDFIKKNIRELIKNTRDTKYARLNFINTNFKKASFNAIDSLYQSLILLKKRNINTLIVGEKNLIDELELRIDNPDINKEEKALYFFILLELYQWKDKYDNFHTVYKLLLDSYSIAATEWNQNSVMKVKNHDDNLDEYEEITSITNNNFNYIKEKMDNAIKNNKLFEMDLSNIKIIDFPSMGLLRNYLYEVKNKDQDFVFIFRNPNEMILRLLKQNGIHDFSTIIEKKR